MKSKAIRFLLFCLLAGCSGPDHHFIHAQDAADLIHYRSSRECIRCKNYFSFCEYTDYSEKHHFIFVKDQLEATGNFPCTFKCFICKMYISFPSGIRSNSHSVSDEPPKDCWSKVSNE